MLRTIQVCFCLATLAILAELGARTAEAAEPAPLVPIGRLQHDSICEASGLAASRAHPGVFWTLNDSGNLPRIYAVDRGGKLLAEYALRESLNIDWEALALADGKLYIGDVGNNFGVHGLKYRWVFECDEPDPTAAAGNSDDEPAVRPLDIKRTLIYSYPDRPFDVEAMFVQGQSLYLISKVTGDTPAGLYQLRLDVAEKPIPLVEVCQLNGLPQVTGADLSQDGRRLAVCSYGYAVQFRLKPDAKWGELDQQPREVLTFRRTGIEACAYDGDQLLMFSEGRQIYRVKFAGQGEGSEK